MEISLAIKSKKSSSYVIHGKCPRNKDITAFFTQNVDPYEKDGYNSTVGLCRLQKEENEEQLWKKSD